MKIYFQQQDVNFTKHSDQLDTGNAAHHQQWLELNIEVKSVVALTLGNDTFAQIETIEKNDGKTANDLWNKVDKTNRMFHT